MDVAQISERHGQGPNEEAGRDFSGKHFRFITSRDVVDLKTRLMDSIKEAVKALDPFWRARPYVSNNAFTGQPFRFETVHDGAGVPGFKVFVEVGPTQIDFTTSIQGFYNDPAYSLKAPNVRPLSSILKEFGTDSGIDPLPLEVLIALMEEAERFADNVHEADKALIDSNGWLEYQEERVPFSEARFISNPEYRTTVPVWHKDKPFTGSFVTIGASNSQQTATVFSEANALEEALQGPTFSAEADEVAVFHGDFPFHSVPFLEQPNVPIDRVAVLLTKSRPMKEQNFGL